MSLDNFIVALITLSGIASTYWLFLARKIAPVVASNEIDIKVDGGYKPEKIIVEKGKEITLTFKRTDTSSCLEEIIIPDFRIKKTLPLNVPVSVKIKPDKPGEYEFSCGMHMYFGKIIVK